MSKLPASIKLCLTTYFVVSAAVASVEMDSTGFDGYVQSILSAVVRLSWTYSVLSFAPMALALILAGLEIRRGGYGVFPTISILLAGAFLSIYIIFWVALWPALMGI